MTSSSAKASLDLSPHQEDIIAQKLKDGEVCKLDLNDCKNAFKNDGQCEPITAIAGGMVTGAIILFLLEASTGHLK